MKSLVAIPVYNEEKTLAAVLESTLEEGVDVLVVDDGSTDGTGEVLRRRPQVQVVRHPRNRGYGAALQSAFRFTCANGYDVVTTLDSDGQHDPKLVRAFVDACKDADVVSGSRYLKAFSNDTPAPQDRRRLNGLITDQINAVLGLSLTDSFCGFKAYRADALRKLQLTETGYAAPMEFWVQAACKKLRIIELPVPRIYLDPTRSFGENLDDANRRLAYYQEVFDRALRLARRKSNCGLGSMHSLQAEL